MVGTVGVCAFDKTGTLTSDKLKLRGAVDEYGNFLDVKSFTSNIISVLTGCHSLIFHNHKILGDPLEKLYIDEEKWTYTLKQARSSNS